MKIGKSYSKGFSLLAWMEVLELDGHVSFGGKA
jgi:hypothetical protein